MEQAGRKIHRVRLTPEGHRDLRCIVDGLCSTRAIPVNHFHVGVSLSGLAGIQVRPPGKPSSTDPAGVGCPGNVPYADCITTVQLGIHFVMDVGQ